MTLQIGLGAVLFLSPSQYCVNKFFIPPNNIALSKDNSANSKTN